MRNWCGSLASRPRQQPSGRGGRLCSSGNLRLRAVAGGLRGVDPQLEERTRMRQRPSDSGWAICLSFLRVGLLRC